MSKILVLHGPNLNLLGRREPDIYGSDTLDTINRLLTTQAKSLELDIECRQSNAEHELIDILQTTDADFLLFNPAGLTHTSVALRDTILGVNIPFIEVHLSNPHAREPFRRQSYFSDIAKGVMCGFGAKGYEYALQAAYELLTKGKN
jgi:3-dehydroquinate dehydratase-2